MAARVHHAVVLRSELFAACLVDRKRVEICSQREGRPGMRTSQPRDNAGGSRRVDLQPTE